MESEDGQLGGRIETGEKLITALRKAGVEFIGADGERLGVKMKGGGRRPKEASAAPRSSSSIKVQTIRRRGPRRCLFHISGNAKHPIVEGARLTEDRARQPDLIHYVLAFFPQPRRGLFRVSMAPTIAMIKSPALQQKLRRKY